MSTKPVPPDIAGLRLLESRNAAIPELLRIALTAPIDEAAIAASIAPGGVVATGAGSSAAHARFLASVLGELGVAARFAPLTSFLEAPAATAAGQTLVVFSQGLSPNARLALQHTQCWHSVWLATAAGTGVADSQGAPGGDDDARRRALESAIAAGVHLLPFPGAGEYGTLLRIIGPMTGYAVALRFAAAASAGNPGQARISQTGNPSQTADWRDVAAEEICRVVAGARQKLDRQHGDLGADDLERNLLFVASGTHTERLDNLRLKLLEGTLRPAPPIWDVLDLAHGPFQQMFAGRATLIAFARADAIGEDDMLARVSTMLDAGRHRLVRLTARLPGPLAIFEHEALMNALVLRYISERKIDPCNWPGKGADAPLYSLGASVQQASTMPRGAADETAHGGNESALRDNQTVLRAAEAVLRDNPSVLRDNRSVLRDNRSVLRTMRPVGEPAHRTSRLEELTWPELEAFLAPGGRTAILPLGSIEQHGPHLPFATDAWIAGELARRLASRLPDAIELPVVPFGCASEHLAFPGTLSLGDDTLACVLCDLAACVSRHGFARLFVFSAHGGNRDALANALARMRAVAGDLKIVAAPGLGVPMDLFERTSALHGVSPDASGHHAGEFETSILLAIAPQSVRDEHFAPGLAAGQRNLDELFYPDLRANAPSGTVGDPSGADASRADAYLEAWAGSLLEIYRREDNWK